MRKIMPWKFEKKILRVHFSLTLLIKTNIKASNIDLWVKGSGGKKAGMFNFQLYTNDRRSPFSFDE